MTVLNEAPYHEDTWVKEEWLCAILYFRGETSAEPTGKKSLELTGWETGWAQTSFLCQE
jgi:hypothetical protein